MAKQKLEIIYQDKEIIIVNKPAGLLTIATAKEKEQTLYHQVLLYEKQKHKSNKVFIVHRLDQGTSGLVMFAKSIKVQKNLQDNWDNLIKYRGYVALVHGVPPQKEDTLKSYLKETKTNLVYSCSDKKGGKLAITKYKIIKSNGQKSLLDIEILTGRKNQIRVQLQDIGTPIIGDKKYAGKAQSKINRMCLHAYKLSFLHPVTKRALAFEIPVPKEFDIKVGVRKND